MTKEQLKNYIDLYKATEDTVEDLYDKFGIDFRNSQKPNFYNNYNYLLHNLLEVIFGFKNTVLLEDYIWDDSDMSFEELCKILNIEDETNSK